REVVVSQETLALLGAAVEVEGLEPLALKGKAQRVSAFRLFAVRDEPERRPESRFVGRAQELKEIHGAWERAQAEQRCELVTIVGEAGGGKARLGAEALALIGGRAVQGRCLPHGYARPRVRVCCVM